MFVFPYSSSTLHNDGCYCCCLHYDENIRWSRCLGWHLLMRCDQNGFIGRTDLGCDDLPPIEARRPDVSLLWPVAARKKKLFPSLGPVVLADAKRVYWMPLRRARSGKKLEVAARPLAGDLILIDETHPHAFVWVDFLFLDVVDHEEVLALLLLLDVGRRQRGLGADRLEADEGERAHQVRAVEAVLADAQDDAVTLELLLGKLQQRDERVLRGLVRHRRRQVHVQHVIERAEDRLPGAELLRGHKQLQRDLGRRRLGQHLLYDGGLMLVHVIYGRLGEIKIGILRRSGGGRINRCLAIVFFQGRRPIVVGSGCWDIRTTTAALQPTKHSRSRSPPTRRRKRRRTTTTKSCVYWHDYYYSLAHAC